VIGHSLVANIAEYGFSVAGYDRDLEKNAAMRTEAVGNVALFDMPIERIPFVSRDNQHPSS
jgi:6-phosphogluconate dehydrogenase